MEFRDHPSLIGDGVKTWPPKWLHTYGTGVPLGLLIVIIFVAPSICIAQVAKKIPVAISHIGTDQVGQSYAFTLKEAIRGSKSFALVDYDTLPQTPRIVVVLVSVEDSQTTGASSAIGISIVYDGPKTPGSGILLTATVITCGSGRVESCAKVTLPRIDSAVEILRKSEPDLWKTL